MKILLGLVLLVLVVLIVRMMITSRRRAVVDQHEGTEVIGPHIPLSGSGQVSRAMRAADFTHVRRDDETPEPGSGPMLRP